jgi:hypothetical protein
MRKKKTRSNKYRTRFLFYRDKKGIEKFCYWNPLADVLLLLGCILTFFAAGTQEVIDLLKSTFYTHFNHQK